MDVLTVVLIASFLPFVSLGWKGCPQSIPTVSYVSRCPADAEEWKSAAAKKDCRALGMNQSCSNDVSFVYHCVLNEDGTKLMEVCTPVWYMSGYCARFSIASKRIINNPDMDCSSYVTPCPSRFPSNESFKYQMCYQHVKDTMGYNPNDSIGLPCAANIQQEPANNTALIAVLVILVIVTIGLLILHFAGSKIKNIYTRHKDVNDQEFNKESQSLMNQEPIPEEAVMEEANQTSVADERDEEADKLMNIDSLSGKKNVRVSLKDVKTIGELRKSLCKKLGYHSEFLWIVNSKYGYIHQDEALINLSREADYTLMLGNGMETGVSNVDEKKDHPPNRSAVKCHMECGHTSDAETLLKLIRYTLPGTEYTELKCPLCSVVWEKKDLVSKCEMSEDEKCFLDCVLKVNRETKRLKGNID